MKPSFQGFQIPSNNRPGNGLIKNGVLKEVTSSKTGSSNSFSETDVYNTGGYIGTLSKSGESYLYSGSYKPSDTIYVTAQPSSGYSSGGYVGTLSQYVYSGSYTPADSFVASTTASFTAYSYSKWNGSSWALGYSTTYSPSDYASSKSYNSGGYIGTLYYTNSVVNGSSEPALPSNPTLDQVALAYIVYKIATYSGTVTKPATDTRAYAYQGYVTKSASDTRLYRQDYKGTVYLNGQNKKYRRSILC